MKIRNVLSLFDGISCGQLALNRAGVEYQNYYASEINKYAIQVTQHNWPRTTQLGDITKIQSDQLLDIDLIIGGSPCQGFSVMGKLLNFEDPRSKLFFEYVRLLNELKPKYFLLENVKMNKMSRDIISSYLNVQPIEINSALVSGQRRKRLYWTNIPNVIQPDDKHINFDKVVWRRPHSYITEYTKLSEKFPTITTRVAGDFKIVENDIKRKITPQECEILQTIPVDYTSQISDNQRFMCLGNCWTIDVISHILSFIK